MAKTKYAMHLSTRCGAKSKRTGKPCRAPAVRGWTVCRMHGAGGGAKPGREHPNWKHGGRTHEAIELRKMVNEIGRDARRLADMMNPSCGQSNNAHMGDI